jgi:hypothetical protein
MVKAYKTIKQLYELFERYPEITLFEFYISESIFSFEYHKDTKHIITTFRNGHYELRRYSIEEFIIKLNCQIIDIKFYTSIISLILTFRLYVTIVDGDFKDYYNAGMTILRYWKKFRYNVYLKHRDPLKKELMEYFYHPSKINFELD